MRLSLLELPTAREARKTALRHEARIRPEWERVMNRVMATAIWMKCREHVEAKQALLTAEQFGDIYTFKDHYWATERVGVSAGFYGRILKSLQTRMKKGGMRVIITGSREFSNPFLFQAKLQKFFGRTLPDEILIRCVKGADAMAEFWAMDKNLPVAHYPVKGGRSKTERSRRNTELIAAATHLVAFVQGQDGQTSEVQELVSLAEARQLPVRLVRLDEFGRPLKVSRARTGYGRA